MLLVEAIAGEDSMVCRVSRVGVNPLSFWCAYYGEKVLAHEWEPFDQPRPDAYMPYRSSEFEITKAGKGAVYVKKVVRRSVGSLRKVSLTHKGHARDATEAVAQLRKLFQPYGVPLEKLETLVVTQCKAL